MASAADPVARLHRGTRERDNELVCPGRGSEEVEAPRRLRGCDGQELAVEENGYVLPVRGPEHAPRHGRAPAGNGRAVRGLDKAHPRLITTTTTTGGGGGSQQQSLHRQPCRKMLLQSTPHYFLHHRVQDHREQGDATDHREEGEGEHETLGEAGDEGDEAWWFHHT